MLLRVFARPRRKVFVSPIVITFSSRPFATIARARDEVRNKVAAGLTRDLLVLIRGGTYEQAATLAFGPKDSGTEKCSITYSAYPGEEVIVSGGQEGNFELQNLSAIRTTPMGERETFEAVVTGPLRRVDSPPGS